LTAEGVTGIKLVSQARLIILPKRKIVWERDYIKVL